MNIEVSFWGASRRLAGAKRRQVELPEGATVQSLSRALESVGDLASLLPACAFAVGTDLVTQTTVLENGQEVSVLPPVSGG